MRVQRRVEVGAARDADAVAGVDDGHRDLRGSVSGRAFRTSRDAVARDHALREGADGRVPSDVRAAAFHVSSASSVATKLSVRKASHFVRRVPAATRR